ncbi:DUF11 domain-containing protein [Dehalobacter sp. DCM]|uniref:DUF7507 domain-containing protein n=1 Tax=Dehalobacter sp. DCM TaxID=2907827 RepID=UPI0030818D7D|nr:DUF11 domain-containing protein [Dehalobacter sp. DCM]
MITKGKRLSKAIALFTVFALVFTLGFIGNPKAAEACTNDGVITVQKTAADNKTDGFVNVKFTLKKKVNPERSPSFYEEVASQNTNTEGIATFTGLAPGDYRLYEDVPKGYASDLNDENNGATLTEFREGEQRGHVSSYTFNVVNTPVVVPVPNIALTKTADKTTLPLGGGTVVYTYNVTNPGDMKLFLGVKRAYGVSDDNGTPEFKKDDFFATYVSGDSNNNYLLEPGETWIYTSSERTIKKTTTNTATAKGYYAKGDEKYVTATASATVKVEPPIDIVKTANPTSLAYGGGSVTYTYEVTNKGKVRLYKVQVLDDNGTPADPTDDFTPECVYEMTKTADVETDKIGDALAPGQTWKYTATRTIQVTTTNTAKVTAYLCGEMISDEASATVTVAPYVPSYNPPASRVLIALAKTANVATLPFGGGPVTYTYTVTNPGDVLLSGVSVKDDNGTPSDTTDDFTATYVSGDTVNTGYLDPSETWIFTATATVKATKTNIGTAAGTYGQQTVTATDSAEVIVLPQEKVLVPTDDDPVAPPAKELPKTGGSTAAFLVSGSAITAVGALVRRFNKK